MKQKPGWTNVRVPRGLIEEVDRYIAESKGAFTSKADFVKAAIREKLDKKEELLLAKDIVKALQKNPDLRKLLKKKR